MKKYLKCILLVTLIITSAIALSIGLTGCADARGHKIVNIAPVTPTCEQDGRTGGSYCERCGMVVVESQVVPKLGHNYVRANCTRCQQTDPEIFRYASSNDGSGSYAIVGLNIDYVPAMLSIPASYKGSPVSTIGNCAFMNCTDLVSVTIPSSIKLIEDSAFLNCYKLVEIINNSTLKINKADATGNGAIAANALEVHNGERKIESVDGFIFGNFDKKNYLFGFDGDAFNLVLPESYSEENYEVYKYAFYQKSGLNSVVLGGATIIGEKAFYACDGIVSITVSQTVKTINKDAFLMCFRLAEVINHSTTLKINKGDTAGNGAIAANALEVHSEESKVIEVDDFMFYDVDGVSYLLKYAGLIEDLYLPNNYQNHEYVVNSYAFYKSENLVNVIVGDGVNKIGENAFNSCPANIRWSKNPLIKEIGSFAFAGSCANSIVLPNTILKIGANAFEGCASLNEFIIPNSVSSIGKYAFKNCAANIAWDDNPSIKEIGSFAFAGSCANSIVLPNTITKIGEKAFEGCYSLDKLDIPNAVTSIGKNAFSNSKPDIEWGKNPSIKVIGDYAFANYKGSKIVLPNTISSIGNYAFSDCVGLHSLNIPSVVTDIGERAFRNVTATIVWGTMPQIKEIGVSAFSEYAGTSINIPNSVITIEANAFSNCPSLKEVVIGDRVTIISSNAFYGCVSLKDVTMGNSVETIANGAFSGCTALSEISIPDSTTLIDQKAFYGCVSLKDVTMGNSVETIADGAFSGCAALSEISIPDSTTRIEQKAFYGCTSLKNVSIGNSVTYIGVEAFKNTACYNDANCWTNKVFYIGSYLIDSKKDVSGEITVKDGTLCIACDAFKERQSLKGIKIAESVVSICEGVFYNCDSLISVVMPNRVQKIEKETFYDCERLTSVVLGSSVESIESQAFVNCYNLVSITLGKNFVSIQSDAFKNCYKLVEVINLSSLYSVPNYGVGANAKTVHSGSTKIVPVNDYLFYTHSGVNYLMAYTEFDNELVLPQDYNGNNYELYKRAFISNEQITDITIPASVVAIGERAFHDQINLKGKINFTGTIENWCAIRFEDHYSSPMYHGAELHIGNGLVEKLVIPASVESIGQYAFRNCDSLTSLYIDDSVTKIGMFAFENCSNLSNVRVGSNAVNAEHGIFNECPIKTIIAPINAMTSVSMDKVYSVELNGGDIIPVTLFMGANNLVSLTLPESIIAISANAFVDCHKLVEIVNNSTLSIIAGSTYYGGIAYNAIEVHRGTSKLVNENDYLFYTCDNVNYLLGYANEATVLNFPNYYNGKDYEIYKKALINLGDLTEIVLGEGVTKVHSEAFANCTDLSKVTIHENILSIDTYAFSGCRQIATVTMPAQVIASIPKGALKDVTVIGSNPVGALAFNGATALEIVRIGNLIPAIGASAFADCTSLASVSIGNSVTEIKPRAFQFCSALKRITIPSNVETIGAEAFKGCSELETITLGKGIQSIDGEAFYGCKMLITVNYEGKQADWKSIFIASGNDCLLEADLNLETVN